MARVPFRIPFYEALLIGVVVIIIAAVRLTADSRIVIGEPVIVDRDRYLVAILGKGVELRNQRGETIAYWEYPPAKADDARTQDFVHSLRDLIKSTDEAGSR